MNFTTNSRVYLNNPSSIQGDNLIIYNGNKIIIKKIIKTRIVKFQNLGYIRVTECDDSYIYITKINY